MKTTNRAAHRRLVAWALAPLLITAIIQGTYLTQAFTDLAIAGLERKLDALGTVAVELAGPSLAVDEPEAVGESLHPLARDTDFVFAVVRDPNHRPLAYRGPEAERLLLLELTATPPSEAVELDDTVVRAFPIASQGRRLGTITVGLDLAHARADARAVTVRAGIIAAFGISLGILVTFWLTRNVVQRNEALERLFATIDQGVLCAGADGTLTAARSAVATALVGPHVPRERVWDALGRLDPSAGRWLRVGWDAIGDGVMPLEVCLDQLPAKLIANGRTYRVAYKPRLRGEALRDVLVVMTDVTDEQARLVAEAAERDFLQLIERVTRDRNGFADFLADADALVRRIEATTTPTADLGHTLHTLKGNSAVYGLMQIADACHQLESALALAPDQIDAGARSALLAAWRDLRGKLDRVFGPDLTESRVDVSPEDLFDLRRALERRASLDELQRLVESWELERVDLRFRRFATQIEALAHKLGRAEVQVFVDCHGVRLAGPPFRWFWSAFTHVVRNAVDHGLETTEERGRAGKSSIAHIALAIRLTHAGVELEVRDDGRGIDWDALAVRARERGLPAADRDDLVAAMFADGVTTRDEVGDVSGRGVGLAAVRAACAQLGGTITVDSARGVGTRFRFVFPGARAIQIVQPRARTDDGRGDADPLKTTPIPLLRNL